MALCRAHAGRILRTRLPNIDTRYEGQRGDGAHMVGGTAVFDGRTVPFQCRLSRSGNRIAKFTVSKAPVGSPAQPQGDALVPGTPFHATGNINCARNSGQSYSSCSFGVVRTGGGSGTLTVFWPDGGQRVITFRGGDPVAYDRSEADGGAELRWSRVGDLTTITIGQQRFEVFEAILSGG